MELNLSVVPVAPDMTVTKEEWRQRIIFIYTRERDRQLWLLGGIRISPAEYARRREEVRMAASHDTIILRSGPLSRLV